MGKNLSLLITAAGLCAGMVLPLVSFAQAKQEQKEEKKEHHHYKLVDIGTLGGPMSNLSGPNAQILNNRGTFAAYANTSTPNPNANCDIPFNANGSGGDCFVEKPILWHNGTLTKLELLPGGTNGQTDSIAENGLIAGWSENGLIDSSGLPVGRAVLWTKDGEIIDLGAVPGGTGSLATAVNNRGEVVGFSDNDIPDAFSMAGVATQTRAFLWQNGVMKDLGTLGGSDATAFDVNERGQIAGVSYTNSIPSAGCNGSPTTDPFFLENGKMTDIGTLGGTCGSANWMNNRGQVVGFSNVAGDQNSHAFLWDKEEGLKDLGLLSGGMFAGANWINDAGEIVGGSDATGFFHAVLWKNGAIIDLGTVYGETCTAANSINSHGQIVGFASADCNVEDHAFLWENGAIVDLNALVSPPAALTIANAYDINDRGEVAGWAPLPNGDVHAVLLIPCDEDHADVEGCDYDSVEATTEAAVRSAQSIQAPTAASVNKLSAAKMMKRYHYLIVGRNRRFGAPPLK